MSDKYYIYANISGAKRWHLVYDKRPGLYFVEEDFEEEEYDIEEYRKDFPDNEVVEIPNANEIKNPLGICDDHKRIWNRVECPLCDALFLYDRLDLAIKTIQQAFDYLTYPAMKSQEEIRRDAKRTLKRFLDYAKMGNDASCDCDGVGDSRCPKHGIENLMMDLKRVKTK